MIFPDKTHPPYPGKLFWHRSPAFSEFRGRHTVHIPEKFCKVKLVAEAQFPGNIADRQSTFPQ